MNNFDTILHQTISLFVGIPLLAFLITLFWQNKQERPIAAVVQFTKAFYIFSAVAYAVIWIISDSVPIHHELVTLYKTDHFVFAIRFYYDEITAVFSLVGAILFFLVATFSRYYMHRDEGYKRFFNTILFFAVGYNLIIFSGNFETMFIGWEIIGISSFLLIAFYRNRYLPVKNAFKTLSYYRVSDIALILVMWLMHHLTHQNISFTQLPAAREMAVQSGHTEWALVIAVLLVLAAMIKSAQFPFTAWLPRAMEGPTTSSAIFYGSLSVHIGVFLLLRTWPFWKDLDTVKIVIVFMGALTAIVATLIARVQPTVKTQIAYSSAAQIGIIFIEIALGFHILALVHFAGNAFLRTYQLLVSPSVLNYLVHHQYFHYHPPKDKPVNAFKAGFYTLSIREWNLDTMMYRFLWKPFKMIGTSVRFLGMPLFLGILAITGIAALVISIYQPALLDGYEYAVSLTSMSIALLLILFCFAYRGNAMKAWGVLLLAHVFIVSAVIINAGMVASTELLFYVSGIVPAFLLGWYCLQKISAFDNDIRLDKYHGYVYEEKTIALLFLIAATGLLGFPVTTAFIGIDVFFTYIGSGQLVLIILASLCFLFIELAAIRIYCRIFLGLHKKLDHPVAFRSS